MSANLDRSVASTARPAARVRRRENNGAPLCSAPPQDAPFEGDSSPAREVPRASGAPLVRYFDRRNDAGVRCMSARAARRQFWWSAVLGLVWLAFLLSGKAPIGALGAHPSAQSAESGLKEPPLRLAQRPGLN
jgi:hypothetical protein